MKNTKAFTLSELLGVIVILAIIATIVTPIILPFIGTGKNESFKIGVSHLITALKNEQARNGFRAVSYEFPLEAGSTLKLDGNTSGWKGSASIDKNGRTSIKIYDGTYCASKGIFDKKVKVEEMTETECLKEAEK